MIKLRIDGQDIEVAGNTTIMQAAESAGIAIPAMCFMEGFTNHPSCMVCLVKDEASGNLFASCAMPALEGMEITTADEEVREARREALELLLSDHVGDCEAPCRNGCPAFMDIPLMNRLIADGNYSKALAVVKEEIALPLILGYICEAPCEKVCRRVPIDGAVSICQLKKFVAGEDLKSNTPFFPTKKDPAGKRVAVIGAGPAGLAAAFYLVQWGYECVVFDRNGRAGGSLRKLEESVLPARALDDEIGFLESYGVGFRLDTQVDPVFFSGSVMPEFDAVILATGEFAGQENNWPEILFDTKGFVVDKDSWETNVPGVFACGSAVRKQQMAVRAVAQGKAAAWAANEFLLGRKPGKVRKRFNSRFGKLKPEEFVEYLKESVRGERNTPSNGDLDGFIPDEAVKEASRCMHCDCRKPDTCKLRLYADEYGADRKKYWSEDRKTLRKQYTHETIVYEQEKCIKCGLCVEIASKDNELTGLSFIGRGFDVRVDVPFSRDLGVALTRAAKRCAEACPTAAISMKSGNEK